jgi:hypothetical protein
MKEKIENSEELRDRIVRDEKLLSDLSEKISELLHGKVEIGEDEAYTFVPFVFKKPVFAPEVLLGPSMLDNDHLWWWWVGLPVPELLEALEQYRVNEFTPKPGMPLAKQIIGNRELFHELSECVSSVLNEHGVVISEDVMYVFSPIVYKKPIFAPEMLMSVTPSQFVTIMSGDQIKATPISIPGPAKWVLASEVYSPVIPLPPPTPIDGIPAPELLYALDRFRLK